MSVKWNLYAELRNNQEAADERMEKQLADNNRLLLMLTQAAVCLLFFFWVISDERDWFTMWWLFCMVFWLPLLFEGALEWYSGTVMVKWPPPASLIAQLRQGLGVMLADFLLPLAMSWIALSAAHRPRLAWIGAVLAVVGYYLLRVWCYDCYRKRMLDSGEYGHLTRAEERDNRRAQAALIILTAVSLLPALIWPETALPGGGELKTLLRLEQAADAYIGAEAKAFEYTDGEVRAMRYQLPGEELTVCYGANGQPREAWLTEDGLYYHYDGAGWTETAENSQPVRSSVLRLSREQLGGIRYGWSAYKVEFTQEALRAQLLQLDVRLFDAYKQVEAEYELSSSDGHLLRYAYKAYGTRYGIPSADYYQLKGITINPEQVAAQVAVQKQLLGLPTP